jgi:hypothetical protein
MKIPIQTKKIRWYVAISETKALSSWPTAREAVNSYLRLDKYYPEVAKKVIGILKRGKE